MQLFNKIMIALLAAMATVTLSACGCSSENPMDTVNSMISEVASAVIPDPYPSSDILEEASSAEIDENSDSESFHQTERLASNFREGYFAGYSEEKFVELFETKLEEKANQIGWTNISVEWQEGWRDRGENPPSEAELQLNETPFTGCVMYEETDGTEVKTYYYMKYDSAAGEVYAISIHQADGVVLENEEAQAAVLGILES